jgi:aminoglycoside phosphotransferase
VRSRTSLVACYGNGMDEEGSTLTAALRSFTEDCLASRVACREVSWPHGEARVWAVECEGKTAAFLKQHRQRKRFLAELRAYREFVPVLGESAPRLIGVHEREAAALLLSALPGNVVAEVKWPPDVERALHVRAARLLRQLHGVPVEQAERIQVEARTRESLAHWMQRARAYFPARVIDWAIAQVEAGMADAPPICVCHKDFGPRNWIATRDGQIGLIDFERTCVDFRYLDWSRLWMREWLRQPQLEDAFSKGTALSTRPGRCPCSG